MIKRLLQFALFAIIGFGWFALPMCWQQPSWLLRHWKKKEPVHGRYATSDAFLAGLEIEQPSEVVLAALRQIPESEPILLIGSDGDESFALTWYTIAYLSWPRETGAIQCGGAETGLRLLTMPREPERIRWLLFYRRPLPVNLSPRAQAGGRNLQLVHADEGNAWSFYCSQSR